MSKTENFKNYTREFFKLAIMSLDARLPRDSFRAYKAVSEFYTLILLSCLIGMSMITDHVTTIGEIEMIFSVDPSRLIHLFVHLLVVILLLRLVTYSLSSTMKNERMDRLRISTYLAGFGAALTGCSLAAGSDFVARASEEIGLGSLVFIWAFGYLVAKVWVRLLEGIICTVLIKKGGPHEKDAAANDR